MKNYNTYLSRNYSLTLIIFFIIGVTLRIPSLFTIGMGDVQDHYLYANLIETKGWADGYMGGYFPSSYALFNFILNSAQYLNMDFFKLFSISRFISDLTLFILLVSFLNLKLINLWQFAFIWLNPFLISLLLAGYTDTFSISLFFLFLIIFCKFIVSRENTFLVVSSLILTFFIFLKPQTIILAPFLIITILFILFKNFKNFKSFLSFLLPIILISSLYFVLISNPRNLCPENYSERIIASISNKNDVRWNVCVKNDLIGISYTDANPEICGLQGYGAIGPLPGGGNCIQKYKFKEKISENRIYISGLKIIIKQIFGGSDGMRSYSAQMPNLWHLYAINSKDLDPNKPAFFVVASNNFNTVIFLLNILIISLMAVVSYSKFKSFRDNSMLFLLFVTFLVTFLIPFFSTMAHENHLALAIPITILLISLLNKEITNLPIKILEIIFLFASLLLSFNIFNLYINQLWIDSNIIWLQKLSQVFSFFTSAFTITWISILLLVPSFFLLFIIFSSIFKPNWHKIMNRF